MASFQLEIDHLEIFEGETLRITGSNGSGKTPFFTFCTCFASLILGKFILTASPFVFPIVRRRLSSAVISAPFFRSLRRFVEQ
jgi:energy-coupling factor transporter ATP-binding protein EcfA2